MIEFDIYLSDDSHYNENNFKDLIKAYHNNKLTDNTVELTSITLNLGYDNFSNEEVVDMDSINTIEKMQKLLITLKDIDVLPKHDIFKLSSIFEVLNYMADNDKATIVYCYNYIDQYELWEDETLSDVAIDLIYDDYFGEDVATFYGKYPKYLNMDAIVDDLEKGDKFIETGNGVLEYLD